MIWRRVSARMSYALCGMMNAQAAPPESVNIYPTDRCNLQCSMCFEKLRPQHKEMSLYDWCGIIEHMKKFHPRIHLSGGEPFVYPDIMELVACIKKNGLFLTITTNGTYLEEYAEDIIRLKVNRIHVSIDGPQEIHDRIRGVPGTYDRVINGLQRLLKYKKTALPVIRINSMLNFSGLDANRAVVEIGNRINAESVQLLHPLYTSKHALTTHRQLLRRKLHRDLNYWHSADVACTAPVDYKRTFSELVAIQKTSSIPVEVFPKFNCEQLIAYYSNRNAFNKSYKGNCRAMWNTATILANGETESCPDYVLGNCATSDFLTIWNNTVMKELRKRIRKHDFFTVCRACCYYYQR